MGVSLQNAHSPIISNVVTIKVSDHIAFLQHLQTVEFRPRVQDLFIKQCCYGPDPGPIMLVRSLCVSEGVAVT